MTNPILAEILRGAAVESLHRGAYAIVNAQAQVLLQQGDIKRPIFPRSSVKAFQCVPLIESGAADHFNFVDEDIALACSSHNGEVEHVRVAKSMLEKVGVGEDAYECGAQWPSRMDDKSALIKDGQSPRAIHNNCSGKHAGMLAFAKYSGFDLSGYVTLEHPVQQAVAAAFERYCGTNLSVTPRGLDGCSVPTWAVPLESLATGFAKLFSAGNTTGKRIARAAQYPPIPDCRNRQV